MMPMNVDGLSMKKQLHVVSKGSVCPLRRLTGAGVKCEWSTECQRSTKTIMDSDLPRANNKSDSSRTNAKSRTSSNPVEIQCHDAYNFSENASENAVHRKVSDTHNEWSDLSDIGTIDVLQTTKVMAGITNGACDMMQSASDITSEKVIVYGHEEDAEPVSVGKRPVLSDNCAVQTRDVWIIVAMFGLLMSCIRKVSDIVKDRIRCSAAWIRCQTWTLPGLRYSGSVLDGRWIHLMFVKGTKCEAPNKVSLSCTRWQQRNSSLSSGQQYSGATNCVEPLSCWTSKKMGVLGWINRSISLGKHKQRQKKPTVRFKQDSNALCNEQLKSNCLESVGLARYILPGIMMMLL